MNNNNSELFKIFTTPIWTSVIANHDEVNAKMNKYIKILQSENPQGMTKSNVEGWHSEYFNLDSEEPRFFLNYIN